MDHCNLHQDPTITFFEEKRDFFSEQKKDTLVCPMPHRLASIANGTNRTLRWQISHQAQLSDSTAWAELHDIFRNKEGYGLERSASQVASSPPFYGSPPSRAANPLVQDARFKDEKNTPSTFPISPSNLRSPSSSSCKGGCARRTFGLKPAAVRVEGFDCLNRDNQTSRIRTMV
ncbi:hypothetical protein ACFE04_006187 [Oxalis oulophora]